MRCLFIGPPEFLRPLPALANTTAPSELASPSLASSISSSDDRGVFRQAQRRHGNQQVNSQVRSLFKNPFAYISSFPGYSSDYFFPQGAEFLGAKLQTILEAGWEAMEILLIRPAGYGCNLCTVQDLHR